MCHRHHLRRRNNPPPNDVQQPSKRNRKQRLTTTASPKPSRKTRTKRRKPKYLSLNLKLNPLRNPKTSNKKTNMAKKGKQQLTLFPLHPENLVEDPKYMHDDNNVVASFLFDTATDSTTTLDGLLSSTTSSGSPPSPPSLTFAYRGRNSSAEESDSNGLVRTAMKCKERDASEERWVSYSEVVEKKIKEEEASSCVDDDHDHDQYVDVDVDVDVWCTKQGQKRRLLALKLDYQEILNAWSDKGPLYVGGDTPQTVPDLHDADGPTDAWSNSGNLWSVPEMSSNDSSFKVSDEVGGKEGWNREHREASVLRYKEKRQNRLFSKRIRYEVRKLNAEKRPRMKGRFVKRSSSDV